MNEIPSPGYYRVFQKLALAIGIVTALLGYSIQNSAVGVAGMVILVHAFVATLVIAVEDRRSPEPPARDDSASETM
ncbi:hypothetical protein CKO51_19295 [Rhodopirellula sp. SM50]|nr:hypothetical protein [Rhodopirellula sp. SM50]PAY17840.1 hypothetical protein CKO51_19295 [Rhodopirellula sp. SM50]